VQSSTIRNRSQGPYLVMAREGAKRDFKAGIFASLIASLPISIKSLYTV
jgi:hypothetical protein